MCVDNLFTYLSTIFAICSFCCLTFGYPN